ncbi:glycerol-3-phosphate dehydrogenase [Mesobacterium pallidum]|uniref:glycerol-3-phosphate dehydrogenase n=1 Tax=Mesobacterium pallidum TaxID=2872037 RepID=UPI001EE35FA3|nr:glycerol-3-phosphate dehydrogenase [Mesobacterium pallidum]
MQDLFVIGGGINGVGIARDAVGRGLKVTLAEMGDLGQATSSASTKLFHGGLRYLEYFEARLVRESLVERERLLSAMPHISWPMRFVLPTHPDMRFDTATPASRLLGAVMPWARGRRPAWMIRAGLFLYDHMGGRKILPPTSRVAPDAPALKALKPGLGPTWEYSDCWVQDSRLVALNARDAAARGATILTRTRVTGAERLESHWVVHLDTEAGPHSVEARVLVNAAGPWVAQVLGQTLGLNTPEKVRLVRGSHIVTGRLFDHDKCYLFQGPDGRIVFAIPYEDDFTLIGTTDVDHPNPDERPECTPEERDYLLGAVNRYVAEEVTRDDIRWSYSGVRPLHDNGAGSASAATRDYVFRLDRAAAPLLSVFGGKITTYRKLAEHALEKMAPVIPDLKPAWTAGVPLPGGDFAVDGAEGLMADLRRDHPWLEAALARRLVRCYGTEAAEVIGGASAMADLGQNFGAGLTEAEVRWLITREFARSADDILWRRTKLGLHLGPEQVETLEGWLTAHRAAA